MQMSDTLSSSAPGDDIQRNGIRRERPMSEAEIADLTEALGNNVASDMPEGFAPLPPLRERTPKIAPVEVVRPSRFSVKRIIGAGAGLLLAAGATFGVSQFLDARGEQEVSPDTSNSAGPLPADKTPEASSAPTRLPGIEVNVPPALESYIDMSVEDFSALLPEERSLLTGHLIDITTEVKGNYPGGTKSNPVELGSVDNTAGQIVRQYIFTVAAAFRQQMLVETGSDTNIVESKLDHNKAKMVLSQAYYEADLNAPIQLTSYGNYLALIDSQETTAPLSDSLTPLNEPELLPGIDKNGKAVQYKDIEFQDQTGADHKMRVVLVESTTIDKDGNTVPLITWPVVDITSPDGQLNF